MQIDGRSYVVDVETVARIMNAAVSFAPGRVILNAPAAERAAPGLSKDFARAAISQLAVMSEWKAAICIHRPLWNCRGHLARSLAS